MVNSLVWTAEEAKFLKAVLRWQASAPPSEDEKRRRLWAEEDAMRRRRQQQQAQAKPVGEFRVLVIGGRGTGKTAILTRFGQDTFRGESGSPDPFYEHGCRHPITLSTTTTTNTKTNQLHSPTQPQTQTYMVDALEMPSKQLVSNPMIEQALAITEAAVLVYDVRDAASFRLAQNLAEFMREHFTASSSSPPGATPAVKGTRPYALILVGNKADSDTSADGDDDQTQQQPRQVTWAEGSKAAARMAMPGCSSALGVAFLEVSAKTGENVDQIFPAVSREILRMRRLVAQQREQQAERAMKMLQEARQSPVGRDEKREVGHGGRSKCASWKALFAGRRQAVVGGERRY